MLKFNEIAIDQDSISAREQTEISDLLQISLESSPVTQTGYQLIRTDKGLTFKSPLGILCLDFLSAQMDYRLKHGGLSELLARAIGAAKHPKVLDLTAGRGIDSFILARLGCPVLMLERSGLIFLLLRDALMRLTSSLRYPELQLTLKYGDSLAFLQNQIELLNFTNFDVIYLDPMFPVRKKSALNHQDLRMLDLIVGADDYGDQLLILAKKLAKKVVVKRPKLAKVLASQKPHHQILGSSIRFDVY